MEEELAYSTIEQMAGLFYTAVRRRYSTLQELKEISKDMADNIAKIVDEDDDD